jgi:hypothetical protein
MKPTPFIRYLLIGILFPLLIQYVMYYRFTPNYQPGVFSETGFRQFYGNSVFRYRVAGSALQLWVYHQLEARRAKIPLEDKIYRNRLYALDPQADDLFYLSFYVINGAFAMLLSLALLYLFDRPHWFDLSDAEKSFTAVILQLMVAVSQFVTTPYDVAGYFFEVLSFGLFLKYISSRKTIYFLLTCLLIIVATLVRESSALILSLMTAVYFSIHGFKPGWVKAMILPTLCFLLPYIGLRMLVGDQAARLTETSTLFKNFALKPSTLMGILMMIIIFYLMLKAASTVENRRLVKRFLLFALPYVVMIIFVGILAEFRLWLPLITGTAMLYKLNLNGLRTHNVLSDLSADHTTNP